MKLFRLALQITLILNIIVINDSVFAQWVNNPSANTKLVYGTKDPVNIEAIEDGSGGVFVFWEDKKSGNVSDIYFIHTNEHGVISLRADGKTVSTGTEIKESPVAISDQNGTAYLIWKISEEKKPGKLSIQKLSKSGGRLWGDRGISIPQGDLDVVDYNIGYFKNGIVSIAYLVREPGYTGDYIVAYQTINQHGQLLNENFTNAVVFRSNNRKSKISVISDLAGGAFLFWLENISGRGVLKAYYVDESGNNKWDLEPLSISSSENNVLTYTVDRFGNSVYLSFQYQGQKKSIKHQLITRNGSMPWGSTAKNVTALKGSQINPQTVVIDSLIYLSWTNEVNSDKDIYIQKFDKNGKALWKKDGVPVIRLHGDQFGQKIISDNNHNLIIAWIDRRVDSVYGNIYAQKVDLNGNLMWDSLSVVLGSFYNSQKSYLNLVPDGSGGAIAVFKENREGAGEIFAQKIFNTGTYASQVLGFSASQENEKIRLTWYAANESPGVFYEIERAEQSDTGMVNWNHIAKISARNQKNVTLYEFYDIPAVNGTLYYRIIQKDGGKASTEYELVKTNYLESADNIVLTQNSPNPFTDSTSISFYLPEDLDVTLEIFDGRVELIKELPKQKYTAGRHEIVFKDENLHPGIYFYRFKAGSHIEVKKMVVSPK